MIRLNDREKYALMLAAGCIVVFLVLQLLVFPLIDKKGRLRRSLRSNERALLDMQLLRADYDALQNAVDIAKKRIAAKKSGFSLFSFLDQNAGRVGLKDRIAYMKPSTSAAKDGGYTVSSVEMKLQLITMAQLVTYLHAVETSPNLVSVKRLSVTRTGKEEGFIDAVMEFETVDI